MAAEALGVAASAIQIITAALHTCRGVNDAISAVRDAKDSMDHLQTVLDVVGENLSRTKDLLHEWDADFARSFPRRYRSFCRLATGLNKELEKLNRWITKNGPKGGRWKAITDRDPWLALRLYLNSPDPILKHIDRYNMLLHQSASLWSMAPASNTDRSDSELRQCYEEICQEDESTLNHETNGETQSVQDIDNTKESAEHILTALILQRIESATPAPTTRTDSTSPSEDEHGDVAVSAGRLGIQEQQARSRWAQLMAKTAEELHFPDFAANLYGQAISIRETLDREHDVPFAFRDLASLETQYIRVLSYCHRAHNKVLTMDRLDRLATQISEYADDEDASGKDNVALYYARRDAGNLLLDLGQPDKAIEFLRAALFQVDLETDIRTPDEIDLLVKLTCRAYIENHDEIALRPFMEQVQSNHGWDPIHNPVELKKTLVWLRKNNFTVDDRESIPELHTLTDGRGRNPLHKAALDLQIHASVLGVLMPNHNSIDVPDSDGLTPLMLAVECSNVDAVRKFLDVGASINVYNKQRQTPLHICKNLVIMQLLIQVVEHRRSVSSLTSQPSPPNAQVDINSRDIWGKSALHHACRLSVVDIVSLLLRAGADADARTNGDDTPLMIACKENKNKDAALQIVKLLGEHRANMESPSAKAALRNRGFPTTFNTTVQSRAPRGWNLPFRF